MTAQELIALCLRMPGAYLDTPFGPEPICVRIGKPIFAEVYPSREWATLRCEPAYGLTLRAQYPNSIRRGYRCPPVQQPYKNTVLLDGSVPDDLLREMVERSYQRALATLTREERKRLESFESSES